MTFFCSFCKESQEKRGQIILSSGTCHCHSKTLEKCMHNKGPLSLANRKGKDKREHQKVQSEEIKQDGDFEAGLSENTESSELLAHRWRTRVGGFKRPGGREGFSSPVMREARGIVGNKQYHAGAVAHSRSDTLLSWRAEEEGTGWVTAQQSDSARQLENVSTQLARCTTQKLERQRDCGSSTAADHRWDHEHRQ